jgi:NAD(P)-dependent dehydrogenase (short-subunit alcohol dehydrogenase family)
MQLNLRSQWLSVKYALEGFSERASVINLSSIHGSKTVRNMFPYNVAKAGVNGLTRSLAIELGPLGVRVNAIVPGMILVDKPDAPVEEYTQDDPIDPAERYGSPADVAGLAAYLAAPESSFVTGTTIPVDGGRGIVLYDDRYQPE